MSTYYPRAAGPFAPARFGGCSQLFDIKCARSTTRGDFPGARNWRGRGAPSHGSHADADDRSDPGSERSHGATGADHDVIDGATPRDCHWGRGAANSSISPAENTIVPDTPPSGPQGAPME